MTSFVIRHGSLLAGLLWLLLAAAVASDPRDDALIRNSIRVSLLYYAAAASLMPTLRAADWRAATPRGRLAQCCWVLACFAYLAHVALAFHYFHAWSHAHALERTGTVSGFAEGLYVSYFFTLMWSVDAAWWWLHPLGYARRPAWVGYALHGFFAFIIFNGAIVFAEGPVRWLGLAWFLAWPVICFRTRKMRQSLNDVQP